MREYLKNDYDTLNDLDYLDTFMIGPNHFFLYFKTCSHEERQYENIKKRQKYPQGQILITLTTFKDEIKK